MRAQVFLFLSLLLLLLLPSSSLAQLTANVTYEWRIAGTGNCEPPPECPVAGCGTGLQQVQSACVNSTADPEEQVDDSYCEQSERPAQLQACDMDNACPDAQWVTDSGRCEGDCGEGHVWFDCYNSTTDEPTSEDCYCQVSSVPMQPCDTGVECTYDWTADPSGTCNGDCDEGVEQVDVRCVDQFGNEDAAQCDQGNKPPEEIQCDTGVNCTYDWTAESSGTCNGDCDEGVEQVTVRCVDQFGNEDAAQCDQGNKPPEEIPCDTGVNCTYGWTAEPSGSCQGSCGEGVEHVTVRCVDQFGNEDASQCDQGSKPAEETPCDTGVNCTTYDWTTTPTGTCQGVCGEGVQNLDVRCEDNLGNDAPDQCDEGTRPANQTTCATGTDCVYDWTATPSGSCQGSCGEGVEHVDVRCVDQAGNENSSRCDQGSKPAEETPCDTGVNCTTYDWTTTPTGTCQGECGEGVQNLDVRCEDNLGNDAPEQCDEGTRPANQTTCATGTDCVYDWTATPSGSCQGSCGEGVEHVDVRCVDQAGNENSSRCDQGSKPAEETPCDTGVNCTTYDWTTTPTGTCQGECGEGVQNLDVRCEDQNRNEAPDQCDEGTRPANQTTCATGTDCVYDWTATPSGSCQGSCGEGVEHVDVRCVDQAGNEDSSRCDQGSKPDEEIPCDTGVNCTTYDWTTTPTGTCQGECGEGVQNLDVRCEDNLGNNAPDQCDEGTRPANQTTCATGTDCVYDWTATPSGSCQGSCGEGVEHVDVRCVDQAGNEDSSQCDQGSKPDEEIPCDTGVNCTTYDWTTTPTGTCQGECGEGVQNLDVRCEDNLGNDAPDQCDEGTRPANQTTCTTGTDCVYDWTATPSGSCQGSCGEGVEHVDVRCVDQRGDENPNRCDQASKPDEEIPCDTGVNCTTYDWTTTPTGTCQGECGEGVQNLDVRCEDQNRNEAPDQCDESTRPANQTTCATGTDCVYDWTATPSGSCQGSCGEGVEHVDVRCVDQRGDENPNRCDQASKPDEEIPCDTGVNCTTYDWTTTPTGTCQGECAEGVQNLDVRCVDNLGNDAPEQCDEGTRPANQTTCSTGTDCVYEWVADPTGPCEGECGEGVQFVEVRCVDQRGDENPNRCDSNTRPDNQTTCSTGTDCVYEWVADPTGPCEGECGEGVQFVEVRCVDQRGDENPDQCDPSTRPDNHTTCDTGVECEYEWHDTQIAPCAPTSTAATCSSQAHTTWEVWCVEVSTGETVEDSLCDSTAHPDTERACEFDCDWRWRIGDWSPCSHPNRTCGFGSTTRSLACEYYPVDSTAVTASDVPIRECREQGLILPVTEHGCSLGPCIGDDCDRLTFHYSGLNDPCMACSVLTFDQGTRAPGVTRADSALAFDGTSYSERVVSAADLWDRTNHAPATEEPSASFTLSLWVSVGIPAEEMDGPVTLLDTQDEEGGRGFTLRTDGKRLRLQATTGLQLTAELPDDLTEGDEERFAPIGIIYDDEKHIASLLIDGTVAARDDCVVEPVPVGGGLCLGQGHEWRPEREPHLGRIDEVALWQGRALAVGALRCLALAPADPMRAENGCTGGEFTWHVDSNFTTCTCTTLTRSRTVLCLDAAGNEVDDDFCDADTRPVSREMCDNDPCATWQYSEWSECSMSCSPPTPQGNAIQTRTARCVDDVTNEEVNAERFCGGAEPDEPLEQPCDDVPNCTYSCQVVGEPSECHVVLCDYPEVRAVRERNISCFRSDGTEVDPEQCTDSDGCATHVPCTDFPAGSGCTQWTVSEWERCDCLSLSQTRTASCRCYGRPNGAPSSANEWYTCNQCDPSERPVTERTCERDLCPFAYSWACSRFGACSADCGGGEARRLCSCVQTNRESGASAIVDDRYCTKHLGTSSPDETMPCNEQPCDYEDGDDFERLVAYWPFASDSAPGLDVGGSVDVGGAQGADGTSAAQFNGGIDSFLRLPNDHGDLSFDATGGDSSLSLWFRLDYTGSNRRAHVLAETLEHEPGAGPGWSLLASSLTDTDADMELYSPYNDGLKVEFVSHTTGIALIGSIDDDQDWHHVAVVHDAQAHALTLYVDGNQAVTAECWDDLTVHAPVFLGRGSEQRPRDFIERTALQGALDGVAFWHRVLTDDHILCLFNGGCGNPLVESGGCLRPPTYVWRAGEFGTCSVTCGTGVTERRVWCETTFGRPADPDLCDPATKPDETADCNPALCPNPQPPAAPRAPDLELVPLTAPSDTVDIDVSWPNASRTIENDVFVRTGWKLEHAFVTLADGQALEDALANARRVNTSFPGTTFETTLTWDVPRPFVGQVLLARLYESNENGESAPGKVAVLLMPSPPDKPSPPAVVGQSASHLAVRVLAEEPVSHCYFRYASLTATNDEFITIDAIFRIEQLGHTTFDVSKDLFSDPTLSPGVRYALLVVFVNHIGTSPPSGLTTFVNLVHPSEAPTITSAQYRPSTGAVLEWALPQIGSPFELSTLQMFTVNQGQTDEPGANAGWETVYEGERATASVDIPDNSDAWFRVSATNAIGTSPFSAPVLVETPAAVPSAPRDLTIDDASVTASSLVLAWLPSLEPAGATEYVIQSRVTDSAGWNVIGAVPIDTTEFKAVRLAPDTPYDFRVRARAGLLLGDASNVASATTDVEAPPKPAPLEPKDVVSVGENIIAVLVPPVRFDDVAVWLKVVSEDGSTTQRLPVEQTGNAELILISNLSSFTVYKLSIVLTRGSFESESEALAVRTLASIPGAPPAPTVEEVRSKSARITVNPLEGRTEDDIQAYFLYVVLADQGCGDADSTPDNPTAVQRVATAPSTLTIEGLEAATDYIACSRALGSRGLGLPSPEAAFSTKLEAPTIVSLVASGEQGDPTFNEGDFVDIEFSEPTNMANLTEVLARTYWLPEIGDEVVLGFLRQWLSPTVLRLTAPAVSTGARVPEIGVTTVTIARGTGLTNEAGTSDEVFSTSPRLTGNWGEPGSTDCSDALQLGVSVVSINEDEPARIFDLAQLSVSSTAAVSVLISVSSGELQLADGSRATSVSLGPSDDVAAFRATTSFVPASNFVGFVAVDLTASRGDEACDQARIIVSVLPVDDPPVLTAPDSLEVSVVSETRAVAVNAHVEDVDSPVVQVEILDRSGLGSFHFNRSGVLVPAAFEFEQGVTIATSGTTLSSFAYLVGPIQGINALLGRLVYRGNPLSGAGTSTQLRLSVFSGEYHVPKIVEVLFVCTAADGTPAELQATAQFTVGYLSIEVDLDSAPVLDATTLGLTCATLFNSSSTATLGQGARCSLVNRRRILIRLSHGATVLPGDQLGWAPGNGLRRCTDGDEKSGSLTLLAAPFDLEPTVRLSGPLVVDACTDVTITALGTGLAGRPATYSFSVLNRTSGEVVVDSADLQQSSATSPRVRIDASLLAEGEYTVHVLMTNFLSASAEATHDFKKEAAAVLLVPFSPTRFDVLYGDSVPFGAFVERSTCRSASLTFEFSWSVFTTAPEPLDLSIAHSQFLTRNVMLFNTATEGVTPGAQYAFTLRALERNEGIETSITFEVAVSSAPLSVRMDGGYAKSTSRARSSETVHAIVFDKHPNSLSLTAAWTCTTATGTACVDASGGALETEVATSAVVEFSASSVLTFRPADLLSGTYTFAVQVTSSDGRTASAQQLVFVADGARPVVQLVAPEVVSPRSPLRVRAVLPAPRSSYSMPLTYEWTIADSSWASDSSAATIRTTSRGRALIVRSNSDDDIWLAGGTIIVDLLVVDAIGQSSTATARIRVAAPPSSGECFVSPSTGIAGRTKFEISAPGWEVAGGTGVFQYAWGVIRRNGRFRRVHRRTPVPNVVATLPAGRGEDSTVTVEVRIFNLEGSRGARRAAFATCQTTVQVLRYVPQGQITVARDASDIVNQATADLEELGNPNALLQAVQWANEALESAEGEVGDARSVRASMARAVRALSETGSVNLEEVASAVEAIAGSTPDQLEQATRELCAEEVGRYLREFEELARQAGGLVEAGVANPDAVVPSALETLFQLLLAVASELGASNKLGTLRLTASDELLVDEAEALYASLQTSMDAHVVSEFESQAESYEFESGSFLARIERIDEVGELQVGTATVTVDVAVEVDTFVDVRMLLSSQNAFDIAGLPERTSDVATVTVTMSNLTAMPFGSEETLAIVLPLSAGTPSASECRMWDSDAKEWTTEGVSSAAAGDALQCTVSGENSATVAAFKDESSGGEDESSSESLLDSIGGAGVVGAVLVVLVVLGVFLLCKCRNKRKANSRSMPVAPSQMQMTSMQGSGSAASLPSVGSNRWAEPSGSGSGSGSGQREGERSPSMGVHRVL